MCVHPEEEKEERVRVRETRWGGGVRLELFVSEAAANLSKNMFDPFGPPPSRGLRGQPPARGTAQAIH